MEEIPRISEAEWRVMRIIWGEHPIAARDIIEVLSPGTGWKPKTIKTLLNRLVKKGALGYSQDGRSYLYSPRVSESACVRAERNSFIDRVYSGSLTPMLAHLIEEEDLSAADIAALRRMLAKKGRK